MNEIIDRLKQYLEELEKRIHSEYGNYKIPINEPNSLINSNFSQNKVISKTDVKLFEKLGEGEFGEVFRGELVRNNLIFNF